MKTLRRSFFALLLCAGALPAAQAVDGVIRFHGAVVEDTNCKPLVQPGSTAVRVECDAERARAAGEPADRFRISARSVTVDVQPIPLTSAKQGRAEGKAYRVTLSYR